MDGTLRIPSVTGVDLELRIAGPGGRSYAFIIDWHIRTLLSTAWLLIATLAYGGARALSSVNPDQLDVMLFVTLPSVLIYLLYHPVLEIAMHGRTPGKRMAGVRLVKRDGGVPGVGALLVRNLFRLIDSLPFLYCLGLAVTMITKHSVRVGDIAAGTLLVYDEPAQRRLLETISGGGVERLGLGQAELVRDLLARWKDLKPDVRSSLARRMLERTGALPADAGDDALHEALERLVR